jgi:hypothetical protein
MVASWFLSSFPREWHGGTETMEIRDAFRLMAVEVLMLDMLANRYLSYPDPVAAAAAHREHLRDVLSHLDLSFLGDAETTEAMRHGVVEEIALLIEAASQSLGEQQPL